MCVFLTIPLIIIFKMGQTDNKIESFYGDLHITLTSTGGGIGLLGSFIFQHGV